MYTRSVDLPAGKLFQIDVEEIPPQNHGLRTSAHNDFFLPSGRPTDYRNGERVIITGAATNPVS